MNKQAVTFLSLFSLILVLSVYYVMLPPQSESAEVNAEVPQEATPQETLEEKREESLRENEAVLAASASTSDEVYDALTKIDEENKKEELESAVVKALKKAGYEEPFVEIDQAVIKVTFQEKDPGKAKISEIMGVIYDLCGKKYSPEIKFKGQ